MRTEKQERRLKRLLKKPLREGYIRKCHGCGKQFKSINGHARHKQFYCYWRPERVEQERIANEEWEAEFLAAQKAQQERDKRDDLWVDPKHKQWAQEGTMIGGLTLVKYPTGDGSYEYRWVKIAPHHELVALEDGVEKEKPILTWRMKLRTKLWRFFQWI